MLRNRRNTHKQMQTHTEAMAEIDMRQKKCTMCFQAEVMALASALRARTHTQTSVCVFCVLLMQTEVLQFLSIFTLMRESGQKISSVITPQGARIQQ